MGTAIGWSDSEFLLKVPKSLMREATAALLNAEHAGVSYPRTAASIVTDTNAALATYDNGIMITLRNALAADNSLGCPLN
jgi:hypothetical protein